MNSTMSSDTRVGLDDKFVRAFADLWAQPSPEGLRAMLHPDVVLLQPQRPPLTGKDEAYREFAQLLGWLPRLRGVVLRALRADNLVFIEWQLQVPVGEKFHGIPLVDRFVLKDGLVLERAAYFDQFALLRVVIGTPRLWLGYLRYRWGCSTG